MNCDKCIHKGDMGSCQNFKSELYGYSVDDQEACDKFEMDGGK